jgi:hypothetical protein
MKNDQEVQYDIEIGGGDLLIHNEEILIEEDEDLQFIRMIECVVLQLMISPTLMVQEICHHLDQGSKDQISHFRRDLINSFQAQTNHHFNKGLIKDSPLVQARYHFFLDQTSHFNQDLSNSFHKLHCIVIYCIVKIWLIIVI